MRKNIFLLTIMALFAISCTNDTEVQDIEMSNVRHITLEDLQKMELAGASVESIDPYSNVINMQTRGADRIYYSAQDAPTSFDPWAAALIGVVAYKLYAVDFMVIEKDIPIPPQNQRIVPVDSPNCGYILRYPLDYGNIGCTLTSREGLPALTTGVLQVKKDLQSNQNMYKHYPCLPNSLVYNYQLVP